MRAHIEDNLQCSLYDLVAYGLPVGEGLEERVADVDLDCQSLCLMRDLQRVETSGLKSR